MVLEGRQKDYEIRELSCSREAGALRLRWRYKKATDFLIFVYDSRQAEGFSLETALEELVDTAVMDEPKKLWSPGRAVSWKLMHKTKAEFVRDGKSVAIPVSELDKNVPYGICVFACRLEEEDEEKERLHVYPSDAQENTWFLPVKVKAQIRYRKRLFSSEKYGILYVPRIADYRDGAVCCRVDGAASLLPLPQAMPYLRGTKRMPTRTPPRKQSREERSSFIAATFRFLLGHSVSPVRPGRRAR